jgi:hypothetical protein
VSEIRQYTLVGVTVTATSVMVDATDPNTGNEVEFVFEFGGDLLPSRLAAAAAQFATRAAADAAIVERAAKL